MNGTDGEVKPGVELEFNWDEYLDVMVRHYEHFPDDTIVTFGHWKQKRDALLGESPKYCPYLQMTVGELRELKVKTEKEFQKHGDEMVKIARAMADAYEREENMGDAVHVVAEKFPNIKDHTFRAMWIAINEHSD